MELIESLVLPLQSQSQTSSGGLGDVGDGGRLRCLQGKADTAAILCTVSSTQWSGYVVYGPSAMAAIYVSLLHSIWVCVMIELWYTKKQKSYQF